MPARYPLCITTLVVLLLASALTAPGQSGRRGTRPPPIVNPTPEPDPTPSKPAKNDKPELSLIVGIDRNSAYSSGTLYYSDTVLRACVDRLNDVRTVKVVPVEREMTRGDAIKEAKSETEAFVVLLELNADYSGSATGSSTSVSDYYVDYYIYGPKTADLKGSGRAYTRNNGRSGGIPGTGRTGAMYTEYLLKEAGHAAAEDILKKFQISSNRDPIPH